MPYKSEAQRKYFNANREKLEAEGVDVDEWNESSKGKKLPEKAEKRAYGYSDDYGYIERVPWLNSQSRTEVLERMAKAQKLAKKQKLDVTYATSRWGEEDLSPEDAYKMVEALPDSAFTGEFGYGGTDDTIPWSVSSFTRDGNKYNFRKDPFGIYDHLYGGDDDHEYDEYGNSNIPYEEHELDEYGMWFRDPAEAKNYAALRPKKSWLGSLFGKRAHMSEYGSCIESNLDKQANSMNNSPIQNLAWIASDAALEKQAFEKRASKLKGLLGLGKQLGKGTQNLVDFSFFRKGIDPAQVAGFGAGSVGDVAFDPEQRAQIASGQVPSKLWNPEESAGHNIEGLWRRGFQGLGVGSVANPARLIKKVRQGATANLAKKNQALKGNLPKGTKLIDTPDTGDYAWALGKETLPKATALGIGYAPGMIMSTGEIPDLVRSTAQNVEAASGDLAEAVQGKGGLAESIKGTGSEVRKGVNDVRKGIKDVRENITGKDAGLPALLDSLKDTAEAAGKQVGEGGPLDQLNKNLEPAGELAATVNSGLQSAGAGLKSFGNWVGDNYGKLGLGALGAAGLYGLYKVMRRKAEEEEDDEERSRYVYRMPKTAADFGTITAMQVKEAENKALNTSLQISPHTAIFGGTLGAGIGGLHGLLKDPGYDEETGKKKSRLMGALKGLGMGGALGTGAGALLPPASVLATQGYGKFLMPLHERLSKLQEESLDEVTPKAVDVLGDLGKPNG